METGMKSKTIDESCGRPAGSFKKFLKQKEDYLTKSEEKRSARIKAHRNSRQLSWAA